jgi:hypothetical protein
VNFCFKGTTFYGYMNIIAPEVARKPFEIQQNALSAPGSKGEVMEASVSYHTTDTINIFTICSGHLYEKLCKIMMTSVLNNTESPVKFWFIGSVTSPKFRCGDYASWLFLPSFIIYISVYTYLFLRL